jgi:hypothetical protein
MAQKLRQIVSDLAQDVRAINVDDRISFRYLANKFKDKFTTFLRMEGRSRDIFNHAGIWQSINYIELEDTPVNVGEQVNGCYSLKRSKVKIPDHYSTNYGPLLKILTIDGLQEFKLLSQSYDYESYVTREYGPSKNAAWLQDRYLYVPNTTIDAVKALIVPKNSIDVEKLNGTCSACASPLEGDLNYPEYLITLAKQEIYKELTGGYKQVREDEKGDDNTNRK